VTTLRAAFSNTVLENPMLDVINCLILMKIEDVQKGLTFVNEHARVTLPRVNESMLGIEIGNLNDLSSDETGGGNSSLSSAITKLVDKWYESIRQEAILAATLLAAYLCVAFLGLSRVIYGLGERSRIRGEGGGTTVVNTQRMAFLRAKLLPQAASLNGKEVYLTGPGPTPSGRNLNQQSEV
jgi:hypothetical protein